MYYIGVEEQQAVVEVLKNGNLCRYGPANSTVSNFERGIREKFNTKHAERTRTERRPLHPAQVQLDQPYPYLQGLRIHPGIFLRSYMHPFCNV